MEEHLGTILALNESGQTFEIQIQDAIELYQKIEKDKTEYTGTLDVLEDEANRIADFEATE